MFHDTKSPLASLGVLGGAGAVILGVSQLFGWALTPADAADLSDAIKGFGASVAGIAAIYGRVRATKKVSVFG